MSSLATKRAYAPAPQQQNVIDHVKLGKKNLMVKSVAGSGKTTTGVESMTQARGTGAMVAFSRPVANEFIGRLADKGVGKRVTGNTAHGFGNRAWGFATGWSAAVDDKKKWDKLSDGIPEEYFSFVRAAVDQAQNSAIGIGNDIDDRSLWHEMVDHYDLHYQLVDTSGLAMPGDLLENGIKYSIETLKRGIQMSRELMTFGDMLYMPLYSNCLIWQYQRVLVDEAQDSNRARLLLYERMLKPGGQIILVGDPRQAIFGFAGAQNDSMDRLKAYFNCVELPMTTTFRCPKSVVRLAQTYVDYIEAHESNPEGIVRGTNVKDFMVEDLSILRKEDSILCRNTKPIVSMAYKLIAKSVPCHVEGKKIGLGLLALVNRWRVVYLPALATKLETFLADEVTKYLKNGEETKAQNITDKVETIQVIMSNLPTGSDVNTLRAKIDNMFSDTPEGKPAQTLTLATAHRSKGLEWERVFLLGRNCYMPSPYARKEWQQEQEENLAYVAITRSAGEFTDISVSKEDKL